MPSLAELLLASIKVEYLYRFISDKQGPQGGVSRTVVNCAAAFKWHLAYLRYQLHPDTKPSKEEKKVHQAIHSTRKEDCLRWLDESMNKLKSVLRKESPIAEKQTIQRNNKEALQQRGRWAEYEWVRQMHTIIDEEGWARMNSLRRRLQLINLNKVSILLFFLIFIIHIYLK